jgi:hypothetical protein
MRASRVVALLSIAAFILLIALAGNASAIDAWNIQENAATPAGALDSARVVGQTFHSRVPRLNALEVRWIVSGDFESARDSRIVLHLRRRVDDARDLAAASVALSDLRHNQFARFTFSPIDDSRGQSFYFFLDASEAQITRGTVALWASGEDDYADGQMYLNDSATDRDLVFRAYYEPDALLALSALQRALSQHLPLLLFALVIFLIPGAALVSLLEYRSNASLTEMFALGAGLGVAALSAASLFALWLNIPIFWIGIGIVAASLLLLLRLRMVSRFSLAPVLSARSSAGFTLGALMLLSLAVGLLQIRDVAVPLWKDSLIHARYIAAIVRQEQLPEAFYHFGFHGIAALIAQMSGASIPSAMLVVGQWLITLTGLSVYLLSRRLTGSNVTALASAVCVWFLSPTPAYLITWGRYPLLLGGALLPLALMTAIKLIESPRLDARLFVCALAAFAGMSFAHVRMIAFYLVFAALFLGDRAWSRRAINSWVMRIAIGVGVAALLSGALFAAIAARDAGWRESLRVSVTALDLAGAAAVASSRYGGALAGVAAMGALAALARRDRRALILPIAFAALFALSFAGEFLPASSVILIGFLPIALLIGDLARILYERTAAASNRTAVAWSACIFIVGALGARGAINIVNPATILFAEPDQNAMAWIRENTETRARFLINSDAWIGPHDVPTDGGWWIPFLTGRATDYINRAVLADESSRAPARWIADHHIDFVYLGRRAGMLRKSDFLNAPDQYALVYNQDGVMIFRVLRHFASASRCVANASIASSISAGAKKRTSVQSLPARGAPPTTRAVYSTSTPDDCL